MSYSQSTGRAFWLAFDDHFKFEAGANGLAAKYQELGGYDRLGKKWVVSRQPGASGTDFATYVNDRRAPIEFLAEAQEAFFGRFLNSEDSIVAAFTDFAFGVLASPTAPNRLNEPVHTMNGGVFAQDYLSWHGFIEAANLLQLSPTFWTGLRWINGMAWELQTKARPQEIFPNHNEPLPESVTKAIRDKWRTRSVEEIAVEFENYKTRPDEWKL